MTVSRLDDASHPFTTTVDRSAHGVLREGIVTGVIGAAAVALWFLVLDALTSRPGHTPALLGAIVFGADDPMAASASANWTGYAAIYTLIHFAAFALIGIVAVSLVHRAERTPSFLALLVMLFAAIEVAFTGFVALLQQGAVGDLAWYQVAVGNVVAALSMGWYLWRAHPSLGAGVSRMFDDHP